MTRSLTLAVAIATVVTFYAGTPNVLADAYLVPLDGPDKTVASDYGYTINTSTVNRQVVIQISLTEAAFKSFGSGELTLKRGDKTVVETTCGLLRLDHGKGGILKLTLDPQMIDGGELTIWSAAIKGAPPVKNFGGFRLSIEKLLPQTKAAEGK